MRAPSLDPACAICFAADLMAMGRVTPDPGQTRAALQHYAVQNRKPVGTPILLRNVSALSLQVMSLMVHRIRLSIAASLFFPVECGFTGGGMCFAISSTFQARAFAFSAASGSSGRSIPGTPGIGMG